VQLCEFKHGQESSIEALLLLYHSFMFTRARRHRDLLVHHACLCLWCYFSPSKWTWDGWCQTTCPCMQLGTIHRCQC